MAQFRVQGSLRKFLNGDGISVGLETKDPSLHHHHHYTVPAVAVAIATPSPLLHQKRKLVGYSKSLGVKVFASKSSSADAKDSLSSSSVGKETDDFDDDESSEDSGFQTDELSSFRGLVLDISYRPINVVCWKRAICLGFMEKVPHLLQVVKRRRIKSTLSRKNIFNRDCFTCQYCASRDNLTVDHVLPIVRGGEWTWENLVTACAKCNSRKGQKTTEEANMKLMSVPKAPKDYDILAIPLTNTAIKMLRMREGTPEEWQQYLSS